MSKPGIISQLLKSVAVNAKPAVGRFLCYAKVELVPPKISDIPAIRNDIKKLVSAGKNGRILELSVREVWLNTLVTIEVLCWFFVGECIGKCHLVGYKV
ncbi:ATP synthase F(0) complex subunit g, mitochondrial [Osmia lignaria lignaria]|uniref:ATP synthase F(0) complex subunit g, mitochondrial n=1 Tax=Osmia lignaria lignaria TaxID=1437193 RepID=UPI00402B0C1D